MNTLNLYKLKCMLVICFSLKEKALIDWQDPPERPKGHKDNAEEEKVMESFQLWSDSGEFCPEGTVPIRRTTEQDILRASSIRRFGRKPRSVRRDSVGSGHEVSNYHASLIFFYQKEKKRKEKQCCFFCVYQNFEKWINKQQTWRDRNMVKGLPLVW